MIRHVFGTAAPRTQGFLGLPITGSVHDNHFCCANPCFIAVVTECTGGGSFMVLPVHQVGRVEVGQPQVRGHSSRVLDVKWSPFNDLRIASCSEDCTVKVWDIPLAGLREDLVEARKTLIGHSRRVGLIEWHPTAEHILLSSAYDHKVCVWDVSQRGAVLWCPVRVILPPVLQPPGTLGQAGLAVACVCFSPDGGRLALSTRERRVVLVEPRSGIVLQVSSTDSHRSSKVVFVCVGGSTMLFSTGTSVWNQRHVILWSTEDLSEPLYEEELDGSGVVFPFYDQDTHMLYLAGKGDGNIRYYEISSERPFVHFLSEYRSPLPHKGLAVMPKRGLDVTSCEVFRFYRLVAVGNLIEPVSMIVPRKQVGFQEDLYPLTAGNHAAMTAQEWLLGVNRGPVLVSLRPRARLANPYPETPPDRGPADALGALRLHTAPAGHILEKAFLQEQLSYQDAKFHSETNRLSDWTTDDTQASDWASPDTQATDWASPDPQASDWASPDTQASDWASPHSPSIQTELLQVFYRQQEEIRELREELSQKDIEIQRLQLQINSSQMHDESAFSINHSYNQ